MNHSPSSETVAQRNLVRESVRHAHVSARSLVTLYSVTSASTIIDV